MRPQNISAASENDLDAIEWECVGRAIRERRLERGLTLVVLAVEVGLSQPFLSQVENGRARPSMMSLYRIAHGLATTPQAFFDGPLGDLATPTLLRSEKARSIDVTGTKSEALCHLLLSGDAPFHVLEFDGLPREYLDYWEHDGFEAIYVITGKVEVDIAGELSTLRAGDFLSYSPRLPHRLRSMTRQRTRVLLLETKVEAFQRKGPASHASPAKSRKRTLSK